MGVTTINIWHIGQPYIAQGIWNAHSFIKYIFMPLTNADLLIYI
jgi:hypothetical protein